MASDFFAGVGDRLPQASTTIEDANGAVDLTGATVVFKARKVGGTTVISSAAVVDPDQVNNKGAVTYSWAANDTLVAGRWWVQWIVTQAGKIFSVPNDGADELWINPTWSTN